MCPPPYWGGGSPGEEKEIFLLLPTQTTRRQKMHKSPTGNLPDPHSNHGNIQVRGKSENSSATPVTTWDQKRESLTNITTLNIIGPIATKKYSQEFITPPLFSGTSGPKLALKTSISITITLKKLYKHSINLRG